MPHAPEHEAWYAGIGAGARSAGDEATRPAGRGLGRARRARAQDHACNPAPSARIRAARRARHVQGAVWRRRLPRRPRRAARAPSGTGSENATRTTCWSPRPTSPGRRGGRRRRKTACSRLGAADQTRGVHGADEDKAERRSYPPRAARADLAGAASRAERSCSQLFDGHPEVHAHPHELCIGKPNKWDWPPLDLCGPRGAGSRTLHAAAASRSGSRRATSRTRPRAQEGDPTSSRSSSRRKLAARRSSTRRSRTRSVEARGARRVLRLVLQRLARQSATSPGRSRR